MQVLQQVLGGVTLLEPTVHRDARGAFMETWNLARYHAAGLPEQFVQDNHSRSRHGVLRGLHLQRIRPQGKLVTALVGEVFDVVVDTRPDSGTFGQWFGTVLSADNAHQLWVPPGLAHGFLVLSESADVLYKCTESYAPEYERTLRWNDPDVAVQWPLEVGQAPCLSDKDAAGLSLQELLAEN